MKDTNNKTKNDNKNLIVKLVNKIKLKIRNSKDKKAKRHLDKAEEFFNDVQYEKAIKEFETANKILSKAHLEDLVFEYQIEKKISDCFKLLADLSYESAKDLYLKEQYEEALKNFESAKQFYIKCNAKENLKDCEKLIEECKYLIAKRLAEENFEKGKNSFLIGSFISAKSFFQAAKENFKIIGNLDYVKECEKYISECKTYITLEEARFSYSSGETNYLKGFCFEAKEYFEKALKLFQDINIVDEANKCEQYIELCEEKICEVYENAKNIYSNAVDLFNNGNYSAAKEMFKKAMNLYRHAGKFADVKECEKDINGCDKQLEHIRIYNEAKNKYEYAVKLFKDGKFEQAKDCFKNAQNLFRSINEVHDVAKCETGILDCYDGIKDSFKNEN